MNTFRTLSISALLFLAISFTAHAGDVKIIKENKGGFWGFSHLEETHDENDNSTLQISGQGYVRAKFMVAPESLDARVGKVNRFMRKVFRKIDKGAATVNIETHSFSATWKTLENGSVEILIHK